ncbi:taste receptor type 2 member 123 [Rattus norvegicus]|uniref:Taste receptor type 2 member 123 n=1 Tax=Rattus norvegicus TaxID=10116 RepID=TR123_RAT|nr:taste receptor type 2 member 123 [Rattus norvegicus]Q9JKF0.1 RecName: Full=Taste receptor type 2 member 123; Short=T2R123; AltName: Full=Taste receptor type 2 member 2; Short=T2R2; AltName: Full=Taste receptor type 2 member 23; Short=T2R23 [Rattus norvegicus]AAF45303.1 taste receptor rT2R2 [Rattus norvegicus]|eukprot:NP_775458.1 taste receptor type 2 member 123 [Rattus norvegicus]
MFSQKTNYSHLFTFSIIFYVEIVTGILGNGFIALVNIMDWLKRRRISTADQILTALALTRLIYVWSVLICILLLFLCPHLSMRPEMFTAIGVIWVVDNHFSIWLATCLGVFYFLKIASFSNSLFLYLKWRVKKVVLMIILISLIFLMLNISSLGMYDHFSIDVYEGNMSYNLVDSTHFPRIFLFTNSSKVFLIANSSHVFLPINSLFMLIPFTVSLVAFFVLFLSLWKHHKKMQVNAKGPRDASTMAHTKALQIGFSFLLLYAIYLLFIITGILNLDLMRCIVILLFDHISGAVFSISHSFVLILGNSKLRQATLSVLPCLRCRSKDMDTVVF